MAEATAKDEVYLLLSVTSWQVDRALWSPTRTLWQSWWPLVASCWRAVGLWFPLPWGQKVLDRIHEGHLGTEKCKRRARGTVYCPCNEWCNQAQGEQTWDLLVAPVPALMPTQDPRLTTSWKWLQQIYSCRMVETTFLLFLWLFSRDMPAVKHN